MDTHTHTHTPLLLVLCELGVGQHLLDAMKVREELSASAQLICFVHTGHRG